MIKKFINEFKSIVKFLIIYFPGYLGELLRILIYKFKLKNLGSNFKSDIGLDINCPLNVSIGNDAKFMRGCSINSCDGEVTIGDNISVNQNVDINASNGGSIKIGNDVLIANNVVIRAANHNYKDESKKVYESGHIGGKIIIGNNVWIGANTVILKDVIINDNSVIGAGTVVTKEVLTNEIVTSGAQINKKIKY